MSFPPPDPQPDDEPTLRAIFLLMGIPEWACGGVFFGKNAHGHRGVALYLQENCSIHRRAQGAPTTADSSPSAQIPSAQEIPRAPREAPRRPRWTNILLVLGALVASLAIALILAGAVLRHDLRANLLAQEGLLDGRVAVPGLSAPVTVTRNRQNVPSIHASNLDDLLFAQGYITASDRLFQMDLLRRHAAGTLAEILGHSLLDHDREQRILQLRAAADRAAAALPPDQLHQLQAYARGVNAFITTHNGSNGPNTLPVEFHILHYSPALWQPRDSILVALGMAEELSTYFPTKLYREAFSAHLPPDLIQDLYPVGSWRDHPPTVDTPDLSRSYGPPVLQIPLDSTQTSVREPEPSAQDLRRISADLTGLQCDGCRAGSNNWVVAGDHTASGAPLLSNDMHLGLTAPDIWYEAALHVDGPTPLNVEGFTLPGVPFVLVGRNPYVAWGFTNSGADVQDVLIEHLRKAGSSTEYERPDHTWAPVTHHRELIRVRGGRNITLDVLSVDTNIGSTTIQTPIITPLLSPHLPSEQRALALAWTDYDPSTVTVPLLAIDSAADAASLVAAFAHFTIVSQNLVYADAHHIGYHLLGCIPIRGPAVMHTLNAQTPSQTASGERQANDGNLGAPPAVNTEPPSQAAQGLSRSSPGYTIGSPLSPVPVDALDASYAWSGYIPYDQLPSIVDPASGVIATANARITPPGYPYAISLNWIDPYRVERIYHLLDADIAGNRPLTPADMLRIQDDIHSEFDLFVAQRLAYALDHSAITRKDARLSQAANILRSWNGEITIHSPAAEIVTAAEQQLWRMLLTPQILAHDHPGNAHTLSPSAQDLDRILALYHWGETRTALAQILLNTPDRWLPPSFSNWNDLLASSVELTLRSLRAPRNLSTLTYGPSHPIDIAHPIFGSHSPISMLLGVATGTGNHPNSGDVTTIKAAGPHFGPSERFTADLSNPDATYANITTGESGNPASHWFLDQFRPWLKGTTLPLPLNHPYAVHTLTLVP